MKLIITLELSTASYENRRTWPQPVELLKSLLKERQGRQKKIFLGDVEGQAWKLEEQSRRNRVINQGARRLIGAMGGGDAAQGGISEVMHSY